MALAKAGVVYIENRTGTAVSVVMRDLVVKGVGVPGRMEELFLA